MFLRVFLNIKYIERTFDCIKCGMTIIVDVVVWGEPAQNGVIASETEHAPCVYTGAILVYYVRWFYNIIINCVINVYKKKIYIYTSVS